MTWRPLPEDVGNQPGISIHKSLNQLSNRLGLPSSDAIATVFSQWPSVVGAELAEHTEPQALVNGVLTVSVDDSRWATQLKWLASQITERLNEAAGSSEITRLDVRFKAPTSQR